MPLLIRFAVPRIGSSRIPGRYSHAMDMWVVGFPDGGTPIIEADAGLAELSTKTKVNSESDDQRPDAMSAAAGAAGRDVRQALAVAALDLTTKTAAELERDDVDPRSAGLW